MSTVRRCCGWASSKVGCRWKGRAEAFSWKTLVRFGRYSSGSLGRNDGELDARLEHLCKLRVEGRAKCSVKAPCVVGLTGGQKGVYRIAPCIYLKIGRGSEASRHSRGQVVSILRFSSSILTTRLVGGRKRLRRRHFQVHSKSSCYHCLFKVRHPVA